MKALAVTSDTERFRAIGYFRPGKGPTFEQIGSYG